jgi:CRP/FNR family transcriptional regulator, cyclic AMP receptor protein
MARPAIDVLRQARLLLDLEQEDLEAIASSMRQRVFAPSEAATIEGAEGDAFYVIEAGEAQVTVQGKPLGTVGAGDCFGEIALLLGTGRAATITATSELRCWCLSATDFRAVVERRPAIAWRLLDSLDRTLS